MKNITLSGLAGSGKTTIGKLLVEKLKYEFISVGNFSRKFAKKNFNMDINEFQQYCLKHPEIDNKIDAEFQNYCNKTENLVIDYRLGFHFIKDALHVFLKVSENEAVRRLMKAKRISEFGNQTEQEIKKTMNKRNLEMRGRFIKIYNIDFTDTSNYNLVIDTDKSKNLEDITNTIISKYNSHI